MRSTASMVLREERRRRGSMKVFRPVAVGSGHMGTDPLPHLVRIQHVAGLHNDQLYLPVLDFAELADLATASTRIGVGP